MRCKCINSFGMVKLTWKTFCSPKIINIIYLCVLWYWDCKNLPVRIILYVSVKKAKSFHTHTIVLITKVINVCVDDDKKLDSKWQNWYIHKPSCKLWKPAWSTWSDTFNTTKVFLLTRNTVTFWVFETDFWNNAIRLAELKFKRNPVWHRLMNFLRQTTSKHYKVSIYTRGYTLWGN